LPPALRGVDIGVGDAACVLGAVDVPEVVGTGGVVLEIGGEERLREGIVHGVEEGLLGGGLNGVQGGERQTKQAISVLILGKLRRYGCSCFDCLGGSCDTANDDLISIHLARCP